MDPLPHELVALDPSDLHWMVESLAMASFLCQNYKGNAGYWKHSHNYSSTNHITQLLSQCDRLQNDGFFFFFSLFQPRMFLVQELDKPSFQSHHLEEEVWCGIWIFWDTKLEFNNLEN